MRLSSLCLLTVLATSSAFAPSQPPAVALTRSVALNLSNNNNNENNNHNLPSMEAVQNTLLSTVTAATLLMGSFAPFTADAANAAPATTNTMLMGSSLTLSAAPPIDPLAKERTTLTQSRTAYATASAPIAQLKNEVNVASSELAKDTAAVEKQMKKVKDVKKCLLDVNDKLAQAKGRGNEKLAGILAKNSANTKAELQKDEALLTTLKSTQATVSKTLATKQSALSTAEKQAASAKKALVDAEKKLERGEKKVADAKKKEEKIAKQDKKKAQKQAKEQKKKDQQMKKKMEQQKKKEKEMAKKQAKKDKELAEKQAKKAKEQAKKDSQNKSKKVVVEKQKKAVASAKAVEKKKVEIKKQQSQPIEMKSVGLNTDTLQKIKDAESKYDAAGKKIAVPAPAPAPEKPVKGLKK
ncbi:predicted protein [Thalassiosira pseudonana CCMP1335]|uniref:Uncharacterized protein n=1 Tax=Thalassiosira pseudonana TaxID=35128 RepID=B8CFH0_THAPS|nr:predicted protein [Thalassiosira pseudonana CCMP1335]EED87628.1 predicted protein [Thalassiosira pseudonana CCMP1335]